MCPTAPLDQPPPADVDTLLHRLTASGVQHAVRDPDQASELDWLTFDQLLGDVGTSVPALADRLGGARPAMAASMLGRALLPLVVTPTAVAWSCWRTAPDLRRTNLLVGMGQGNVVAVAMTIPGLAGLHHEDGPEWFARHVLDEICAPLIDALRRTTRVGERHLWGNVALAIAAPFASLLATGRIDGRADRDALLERRPGLADLVEVIDVSADGRALEAVRRRTCCLLAKLPEPHRAMCGTCSLHPRSEHIASLAAYYGSLVVPEP